MKKENNKNKKTSKKAIETEQEQAPVSVEDIPLHVRMFDGMPLVAKAISSSVVLKQSLRYDEGKKAVYMEGSYYYTIIGSVLNMVQSQMVDSRSMMEDMGIFHHQLKYQYKLAQNEVDKLLQHIKYCIREVNVMGTEEQRQQAYQFWIDATDYVTEDLQPKVNRILKVMDGFVKKSGVEKHEYVARLCLVSTLILYVRDNLYPDIMKVIEYNTGFDYSTIFPHGDGSKVYAVWEKIEESEVWPVFRLDFKESKATVRAFDSFARCFAKGVLYRKATTYAQQFLPDDVKEVQKKLDKQCRKRDRALRKKAIEEERRKKAIEEEKKKQEKVGC